MQNLEDTKKKYIGKQVDTVDEADFPGKTLRVVRPGEAQIMNLSSNRLNVKVDENDIVLDIVTDDNLW